eukprot:Phypoly_transcript_01491.p1 GENE.Phypoly_transcript_01491~~Phypoly_transcript_01491.p1  ORF type:complete len:896 (+),score=89.96 Phypoly_transcript_01491:36-2690(+)
MERGDVKVQLTCTLCGFTKTCGEDYFGTAFFLAPHTSDLDYTFNCAECLKKPFIKHHEKEWTKIALCALTTLQFVSNGELFAEEDVLSFIDSHFFDLAVNKDHTSRFWKFDVRREMTRSGLIRWHFDGSELLFSLVHASPSSKAQFIPEKCLELRKNGDGNMECKIGWVGFHERFASWEPFAKVSHCWDIFTFSQQEIMSIKDVLLDGKSDISTITERNTVIEFPANPSTDPLAIAVPVEAPPISSIDETAMEDQESSLHRTYKVTCSSCGSLVLVADLGNNTIAPTCKNWIFECSECTKSGHRVTYVEEQNLRDIALRALFHLHVHDPTTEYWGSNDIAQVMKNPTFCQMKFDKRIYTKLTSKITGRIGHHPSVETLERGSGMYKFKFDPTSSPAIGLQKTASNPPESSTKNDSTEVELNSCEEKNTESEAAQHVTEDDSAQTSCRKRKQRDELESGANEAAEDSNHSNEGLPTMHHAHKVSCSTCGRKVPVKDLGDNIISPTCLNWQLSCSYCTKAQHTVTHSKSAPFREIALRALFWLHVHDPMKEYWKADDIALAMSKDKTFLSTPSSSLQPSKLKAYIRTNLHRSYIVKLALRAPVRRTFTTFKYCYDIALVNPGRKVKSVEKSKKLKPLSKDEDSDKSEASDSESSSSESSSSESSESESGSNEASESDSHEARDSENSEPKTDPENGESAANESSASDSENSDATKSEVQGPKKSEISESATEHKSTTSELQGFSVACSRCRSPVSVADLGTNVISPSCMNWLLKCPVCAKGQAKVTYSKQASFREVVHRALFSLHVTDPSTEYYHVNRIAEILQENPSFACALDFRKLSRAKLLYQITSNLCRSTAVASFANILYELLNFLHYLKNENMIKTFKLM